MLKKILAGFALFLLLIVTALVIAPIAFKAQINNWVKNQISAGFNAKVDYTDVTITWFKSFPNIDISISHLSVIGDSLFKHDTLARLDNFDMTIDIHGVLSGSKYKILKCSIDHPEFRFITDSAGNSNWHILKQVSLVPGVGMVTSIDSSRVTLQIDQYKISNAEISYTDTQRKFIMNIHDLNLDGSIQSSVILGNINIAEFSSGSGGKSFFNKMAVSTVLHYSLAGDSLWLDTLNAAMGKSDLHGTGAFNNVLASQMGQAVFIGELNLKSRFFDLNNWLETAFKPASNIVVQSSTRTTVPITANSTNSPAANKVHVIARIVFDTVCLNKLFLYRAKAALSLQKDSIAISDFSCHLLEGEATAHLVLVRQQDVQFEFNIIHCDIQKTSGTVPVTAKIAPVTQYIKGFFSASLKARGKLNDALYLDYNTLEGDGKIQIDKALITQIPVLADVGKLAKNANLSNLEMNPSTSVIHCKNGNVTVEPTDIKFTNGLALNIKGSNTFAGAINYDMRLSVPTKQMGGIASMAQNFLSGIHGLNIKVPEVVSFSFNVTGTFAKPQAKLVNIGQ